MRKVFSIFQTLHQRRVWKGNPELLSLFDSTYRYISLFQKNPLRGLGEK